MTAEHKTKKSASFRLPPQLVGRADMNRLVRELENLDDFLYQGQIRTPGTTLHPPRSSRMLEELAELNHCSLLDKAQRTKLLADLKKIGQSAPAIHISFAAEPSPKFTQKITSWMRENFREYLLIEVGLQPTIAVGCVVRTDNKVFDMSLRNRFHEYRADLIAKLDENPTDAKSPKAEEPAS